VHDRSLPDIGSPSQVLVATPRGNASDGVKSYEAFLTTEKEGKNKRRRKGSAERTKY
jgi:hypothetical protein